MTVLSSKQQQIREREQKMLKVARSSLLRSGYHGFGLDGIAEELGVSRGTVYNHFANKEELILELLLETLEIRRDFLQRAASVRGTPRYRMLAVLVAAELFARLRSDHYRIEETVRSGSLWEKTSVERRARVSQDQLLIQGILAGIIRDAVSRDELTLTAELSPDDIVLGIWSLLEGGFAMLSSPEKTWMSGGIRLYRSLRKSLDRLLDGYGWQPAMPLELTEGAEGILRELFSVEFRMLKQDW